MDEDDTSVMFKIDEDADLSEAELYLKAVIDEANVCKGAVVADSTPATSSNIRPVQERHLVKEVICSARFLPKPEWTRSQLSHFDSLRTKLAEKLMSESHQSCSDSSLLPLPTMDDERGWAVFCYGPAYWDLLSAADRHLGHSDGMTEDANIADSDSIPMDREDGELNEGHTPQMSTMVMLSNANCTRLLSYNQQWLKTTVEAVSNDSFCLTTKAKLFDLFVHFAMWLYSLMSRVEVPLHPDATSSLRSITVDGGRLRNIVINLRESDSQDAKTVDTCDRIITAVSLITLIVSNYFGQLDLRD